MSTNHRENDKQAKRSTAWQYHVDNLRSRNTKEKSTWKMFNYYSVKKTNCASCHGHRWKAAAISLRCPTLWPWASTRTTKWQERQQAKAQCYGRLTNHTKFLQDIIPPYEWSTMELLSDQGKAHAQVHQEEGGHAHAGGQEESGQEWPMPFPPPTNTKVEGGKEGGRREKEKI